MHKFVYFFCSFGLLVVWRRLVRGAQKQKKWNTESLKFTSRWLFIFLLPAFMNLQVYYCCLFCGASAFAATNSGSQQKFNTQKVVKKRWKKAGHKGPANYKLPQTHRETYAKKLRPTEWIKLIFHMTKIQRPLRINAYMGYSFFRRIFFCSFFWLRIFVFYHSP